MSESGLISTKEYAKPTITKMDILPENPDLLKNSHIVGGFDAILDGREDEYELYITTGFSIDTPTFADNARQSEYALANNDTLAEISATAKSTATAKPEKEIKKAVESVIRQHETKNIEVEDPAELEARKKKKIRRSLGKNALALFPGVVAFAAVSAVAIGPNVKTIADNVGSILRHDKVQTVSASSADINTAPSVTSFNNVMVTGGNTETTAPLSEMMDKGYIGPNAVSNDYSASMSPWASPIGTPSTEASIKEGSQHLVNFYDANHAKGENTELIGYSLGSMATYDAGQRIKAQNGGVWPSDLHMVLAGAPQIHGGILGPESPWAGFGDLALGVPRVDKHPFPPGTVVYYYHDDVYAGGGNENFLTMLHDAVGVMGGGHDIPDINNPNLPHQDFVDKDGVIHRVYYHENNDDIIVTALERSGIQIMDTADANAALNAFFPHNDDPNSTTPPRADVRAGLAFAAKALDRQIDPSGNVTILEDIVANMPDSWKQLMDDGWNGINDVAGAIAKAVADPSPQNISAAFHTVMDTFSKVMGDLKPAIGDLVGVPHAVATVAADQIQQYTGQDMHQQFYSLVDMFMHPQTQTQAWSGVVLSAQAATRPSVQTPSVSIAGSVNAQVPSTAASANINTTLPPIGTVPLPNLNQITPAPATHIPNLAPTAPNRVNVSTQGTETSSAPAGIKPQTAAPAPKPAPVVTHAESAPPAPKPAPAPARVVPTPVIPAPAPKPAPVVTHAESAPPAPKPAPAPARVVPTPVIPAPAPKPVLPTLKPAAPAPMPRISVVPQGLTPGVAGILTNGKKH